MPAANRRQMAALYAALNARRFKANNQWKYQFSPPTQQQRRRSSKPKTPAAKACSYCGGKVGQGFKQITIPRVIQIRICAACQLKLFNWVFEQMGKGKDGDKNTADKI
jgi:hypothetical protein